MLSTARFLAADPRFLPLLQTHLNRSLDMYGELEQALRLLDSQEKWLLAFVIYRQSLASATAAGPGPVYASAIWEEVRQIEAFSRNTVMAFIDGMVTYGIAAKSKDSRDRRYQEIHLSPLVHRAFLFWYGHHAGTLDRLDGGARCALLQSEPGIIARIHPVLVDRLIAEKGWHHGGAEIDAFYGFRKGYLILDFLMARLQPETLEDGFHRVGLVPRAIIAEKFGLGRSTIHRLFEIMDEIGISRWRESERGSELWLSRNFVSLVCQWQANKFARVDHAFRTVTGTGFDAAMAAV